LVSISNLLANSTIDAALTKARGRYVGAHPASFSAYVDSR